MIQIQDVTKQYQNSNQEVAVNRITTTFEHGLIHGIIGSSGAGKSTLIRLINRLETYDSGTIKVFEYNDVRSLNKESTRMLRRRIGMMFQTDHLLSRKTVLENILLPITFHRTITKEDTIYAHSLLEEVGLENYANRYPSQLSGGQRQRIGIARALIHKPELLLCDEPTSALDVITTKTILALLRSIAKSHQLDVIIVTHDMNVIKEICDTVTVMEKGHIVEQGLVDDILYKAKHPQTRAFAREIGLDIETITSKYNSSELLLLKYDASIVEQSIISNMVQTIQVHVSILYANISLHHNGVMVLHVPTNLSEVKKYLQTNKVVVEDVV